VNGFRTCTSAPWRIHSEPPFSLPFGVTTMMRVLGELPLMDRTKFTPSMSVLCSAATTTSYTPGRFIGMVLTPSANAMQATAPGGPPRPAIGRTLIPSGIAVTRAPASWSRRDRVA